MKSLCHIQSLLVASLIVAVLVIVPTVSATYAHSCCIERAGEKAIVTSNDTSHAPHGDHMSAPHTSAMEIDTGMPPHHPDMEDSDCEAICCASLIVYGLTAAETTVSASWIGPEHFRVADNISVSASEGHITPPPRFS